jgi:hypothetical protein
MDMVIAFRIDLIVEVLPLSAQKAKKRPLTKKTRILFKMRGFSLEVVRLTIYCEMQLDVYQRSGISHVACASPF